MSDVDLVFREALELGDSKKAIDFIFKNFPEIPSETLIKMWDDFLNYEYPRKKPIKKMQTGLGMASSLPYNSVFRGKVTDLY